VETAVAYCVALSVLPGGGGGTGKPVPPLPVGTVNNTAKFCRIVGNGFISVKDLDIRESMHSDTTMKISNKMHYID